VKGLASDFGLRTSDFKRWFRASLIANIAFGSWLIFKALIQSKLFKLKQIKNGQNDLDCKCKLLECVSEFFVGLQNNKTYNTNVCGNTTFSSVILAHFKAKVGKQ
jgi:hypothetical protein